MKTAAVLAHTLSQIAELRAQMRSDDVAIAQIRTKNTSLKVETDALRDETRSIIDGLWTVFSPELSRKPASADNEA